MIKGCMYFSLHTQLDFSLLTVECVCGLETFHFLRNLLILSYIQPETRRLEALSSLVTTWEGYSTGLAHNLPYHQTWMWNVILFLNLAFYQSLLGQNKLFLVMFVHGLCLSPLSHFTDESVCGLGNAFKSISHPAQIAPEWVLPTACPQLSRFEGMAMIPGSLFLAFSLGSVQFLAASHFCFSLLVSQSYHSP